MENILITMNDNGDLRCTDPNGGHIEEMKARQLVISLNDFFKSSVISYFTICFEPFGLGKKIVTDNIYKSGNTGEVSYSVENGTLTCPIFDYISVSPKVSLQIDGYETDENSDVCAIYKSGILNLHFSESLVGEKIIPVSTDTELKLSERISQMLEEELAASVFTSQNIEDGAVTTSKLAEGAVTSDKIEDNAVVEAKINNGAVTTNKIASGAVTSSNIAQGTVVASNIADNAIKTSKINPSAVTNEKLATGAVTSGKIGSGEVMSGNIADNAVKESKINSGAVTSDKIASGAVISSKIASGAIASSNIANAAVTSEKIGDQAVTTDKIASGAVTSSKIAQGTILASNIADNAIKTSKINPSAVTNEKLATGAVTSGKIGTGEVYTGNLADNSVKTVKINNGAVTTDKISNEAVTRAKLAPEVKTALVNASAYNVLNDEHINFIAYSHTNTSPYKINTAEEYIYNCKQGYTAIKGDLRLTSDNKIIMCHDAGFTFDVNGKITTYDAGNCTLIHDMTYAECMAKQHSDGTYVCDFETYIAICKRYGKTAAFDLRHDDTVVDVNTGETVTQRTITVMLDVLDKYNMRNHCLVACDRTASVQAVRSVDSNINVSFTGGRSDDVAIRTADGHLKPYVQIMLDAAIKYNCIYFGFDFPSGYADRSGIEALDVVFDVRDDNGNLTGETCTAIEYAHKHGLRFYECVIVDNVETYNGVEKNVIEECIKRGVVGFTTEDVVPDFAKKNLSEFVSDSTHRTVTDAEKTTWNGKYTKPQTGIPKTDLASDVQTSLEKAETALQTHQDISGKADVSDIPTKTSDLTNDSGFLTSHQDLTNYVTTGTAQDNITGRKSWIYDNNPVIIIDPSYQSSGFGNNHAKIQINNPTATSSTSYRYGEIRNSGYNLTLPSSKSGTFALLSDIPDISGKENASNKVTTIDASNPGATEYPSESAVVSYVSGIVGNINTILDTINGEVI